METQQYIAVAHLCKQYKVTEKLFKSLDENGLVAVTIVEEVPSIHIGTI